MIIIATSFQLEKKYSATKKPEYIYIYKHAQINQHL